MLARQRDICKYVKKLAVRPNYYLSWPRPDEHLEEDWVVEKLESLACSFENLHTFDWDGLELPDDRLWETLRLRCPKLKSVFTNVGTRSLDPSSRLFDFTDLTSFSLIVRHGLGGSELFPPLEHLPPRFWDMIIKHCPNLEELAICSFSSSSRVFDFEPAMAGHWPKLHTLTLGSFGYQSDFLLGPPSDPRSLGDFLTRHTALKYIRFLWNFKRWMSPETMPMHLGHTALPNLDTYIGVYQQLAELPHPESVETLDLTCEPMYESRLNEVCEVLSRLTELVSLDIWTHVMNPARDNTGFYRTLVQAVPKLTDFHFMCTTGFPAKQLKQLIKQLHLLPDLKRFSLTKGHTLRDESMLETALLILRYNPRLKQINVRWAKERCPNHLKQEGSYDVVADSDGRPVSLVVLERGIPLMGKPFTKRYKVDVPRLGEGWRGKVRKVGHITRKLK
ncbi:hypothetical protein NP233_g9653 [Leucocoprinus birnbaumii]|uniref:Uncharacterized protein n=1 Tax=Leucocoprinus birnbaumii TaxID=56174 RepID=A0AAD5VK23_9AGAR|nr:hypothetical protein NP233_g9653 [Leucocoprinus birnbaumii]